MIAILGFMALALVLGFKHSYDSDLLIAVSNILRKVDSIKSSIKVGFSWAVGHMITATVITIVLYMFRENVLNDVLPHFEKIAGIMLVILGILSFRDFFTFHFHKHSHGSRAHSHLHLHEKHHETHFHKHMFGIGIIHGLASNDELLLLFTASFAVTSLGGLILGLGIFSVGVVLGMLLFTCVFSYPLVKLHSNFAYRLVTFVTGSAGVAYGALMVFSVV